MEAKFRPHEQSNNSIIILQETEYEGITYVCPSWEQMGEFNFNLGREILHSGKSFDKMVALAKGGLTWARSLADSLKIEDITSLTIKTYGGINQAGEPKIVQPLSAPVHGERVLLFDEVIDSGITIKKAVSYLEIMGAADVQVATLCYKPRSSVKPDYHAFSTDAWVAFPHEIREFVGECSAEWRKLNLSDDQLLERFVEIGVRYEEARFYMGLN